MKARRSILTTAVAAASFPMVLMVGAPAMAFGIDVDLDDNDKTVETFEVYGKVRLSLDYGDSDLEDESQENKSAGLTDGSFGLSSNTTVIGFRGSYSLEDAPYTVVWQLEQNFNPDTSGGEVFGNRDTYLGLKTPVGLFRAGHMDTPFKIMGLTNSIFVTTAGDPYAVRGRSSISGVRLDLRGQNSLYWNGEFAGVKLAAQYALDAERGAGDDGNVRGYIDNNSDDMYSVGASYAMGGLTLSTAYEDWSDAFGGGIEAWRVGAKYGIGAATVGALYGDIDTDDTVAAGSLNRSEYGLYAQYKLLPATTLGVQWMHADESEFGDDEADQYSVGVYQSVFPKFLVHAIVTTTQNGDAGKYQVGDYAHGDKIATVPGGDPMAVSVGAQYSF